MEVNTYELHFQYFDEDTDEWIEERVEGLIGSIETAKRLAMEWVSKKPVGRRVEFHQVEHWHLRDIDLPQCPPGEHDYTSRYCSRCGFNGTPDGWCRT